tara:strand:+ start:182 stop:358 length:177 start_codon:yes stop_codon:yes gene_type:complete
MKLNFNTSKPNTSTVAFRIDVDTKKKLAALKKCYGVRTGVLIRKMIVECHESLAEADK